LTAYAAIRLPKLQLLCCADLGSFLMMALANGTWWCWWFGDGFGNSVFIETLAPLMTTAELSASALNPRGTRALALALLMLMLVGLNLYLLVGYLLRAYHLDGSHTVQQAYLWVISAGQSPWFHPGTLR